MKINVESRYNANGQTVAVNVKNGQITQRQYDAAMRKLGAVSGDYLRLSPVGKKISAIDVVNASGKLVASIM